MKFFVRIVHLPASLDTFAFFDFFLRELLRKTLLLAVLYPDLSARLILSAILDLFARPLHKNH